MLLYSASDTLVSSECEILYAECSFHIMSKKESLRLADVCDIDVQSRILARCNT